MKTNFLFLLNGGGRNLILFTLIVFTSILGKSQSFTCGTTPPPPPTSNGQNSFDCSYNSDNGKYTIPVVFHNFSGIPVLPSGIYNNLLKNCNYFLRQKITTPFTQEIHLELANFDIDGACFDGIKNYKEGRSGLTFNPTFIAQNFQAGTYSIYQERYLNIFIFADISGGYSGFSTFPDLNEFPIQGIGLSYKTLFQGSAYEAGSLLAHEFGHFCNLYHTHTDLTGPNIVACPTDPCGGDMVASTNPGTFLQNFPTNSSCEPINICNDPAHPFDRRNIMTNFCKSYFEQEQMDRASKYLNESRSNLFSTLNLDLTLGLNSNLITGTKTFSNETVSDKVFKLGENAKINIVGEVTLNRCRFEMDWGNKINVVSGAKLVLNNTNFNSQCTKGVWDGISVESYSTIIGENNSSISGADIGVHCKYESKIDFQMCSFSDNRISVQLGEVNGSGNIENKFVGNVFNGRTYTSNGNRDIDPFLFPTSEVAILAYKSGSLFVTESNIFDDNFTSIYSKNNLNFINGNTIKSGVKGFVVTNTAKKICRIENNNIKTDSTGIDIFGADIIIHDNEILSYKSAILKSVNPVIGSETSSFYLNILDTWSVAGSKAIIASFPHKIQFLENQALIGDVSLLSGVSLLIDNANQWYGNVSFNQVFKSNIENNVFGNAFIKGSRNNYFGGNVISGTTDIGLSSINEYDCNFFYSPSTIKYNCMGSDFLHNYFYEEFNLSGSGTAISPQINRGNEFTFLTAKYSTEILNLANNVFIVKNVPPFVPTTINGPDDWFVRTGGDQPGCGNPTYTIPTWTDDVNNTCLDSLFAGTRYARYTPRQKWIMLFTLYRIYKKNYKKYPLSISACGLNILQTYKTKDIGKLASAYDKIDSLRGLVPIGTVTNSIAQAMTTLSGLVQTRADVSRIHAQWQTILGIAQNQTAELTDYQQRYNTLKSEILIEANEATFLASEEPAIRMAEMIPMILAALESDSTYFDTTKIDYLINTGESCPNDVGEAKYAAMAVYTHVTGLELEDKLTPCDPAQQIRSASKILKSDVHIYPNPGSEYIIIESKDACVVEIYGITGNTQLTTNSNTKSSQINIAPLNPGLYLIKCTTESGDVSIHKFVKQ